MSHVSVSRMEICTEKKTGCKIDRLRKCAIRCFVAIAVFSSRIFPAVFGLLRALIFNKRKGNHAIRDRQRNDQHWSHLVPCQREGKIVDAITRTL